MKRVTKLSLLFGMAAVTCGVVGSVSIATTEETGAKQICDDKGVTGEVVLGAEQKDGVCVEAGTEANIVLNGEIAVKDEYVLTIGKDAKVSVSGEGVINQGKIRNGGNLTISGNVVLDNNKDGGYAISNQGILRIDDGAVIRGSETGAAIENGYSAESVYEEGVGEMVATLIIKGGVFGGAYVVDDYSGAVMIEDGIFETTEKVVQSEGAKVTGGTYSVGTADLRMAVARGGSGKEVNMTEDGKYVLANANTLMVNDIRLREGELGQVVFGEGAYTVYTEDPSIAIIDDNGTVLGRKAGTTTAVLTTLAIPYNEATNTYEKLVKRMQIVVYQVISDDKAAGVKGEEVAINLDGEMEVANNLEAQLEVKKLEDGELTKEVQSLLEMVTDYKEIYDVSYTLDNGKTMPVVGQKMKVYLKLSDELMEEDNQYYQVMAIKDDGSIGEVIRAQVEETADGQKRLAFETTELSKYAVRASKKPFTSNNTVPTTPYAGAGVAQEEAENGGAEVNMAIIGVALVSIAGVAIVIRKRMLA